MFKAVQCKFCFWLCFPDNNTLFIHFYLVLTLLRFTHWAQNQFIRLQAFNVAKKLDPDFIQVTWKCIAKVLWSSLNSFMTQVPKIYRNHSISILFLYDRDLHHERVKVLWKVLKHRKVVRKYGEFRFFGVL